MQNTECGSRNVATPNSRIERGCRIEDHPLGGEQIEVVERRDDLAADEQFFQRLAIA